MKSCVCLVLFILFDYAFTEDSITVSAVAGTVAELPCDAAAPDPGDGLRVLVWHRLGEPDAIYSHDFRGSPSGEASGRSARYSLAGDAGRGRVSLQVQRAAPADAGRYRCLADFDRSPAKKTYVELAVIEPPRRLWVVYDNGSKLASARAGADPGRGRAGPYYVGDTAHLVCVAFGGSPPPTLTWLDADGAPLSNASTPLSTVRVSSRLALPLARADRARALTCRAANHPAAAPLDIHIEIDMLLPPELVQVRAEPQGADTLTSGAAGGAASGATGTVRVRAGDEARLQCRVLGAHPPPDITWWLNGTQLLNLDQNITSHESQLLTLSSTRLLAERAHDEAGVACCAAAHARAGGVVCSAPLALTVLYRPVLSVRSWPAAADGAARALRGSGVRLVCSADANPPVYELLWYKGDEVITAERAGRLVEPELRVAAEEAARGEYSCAATNAEGSVTSDPLRLDVVYPPYCDDPTPASYGVSSGEAVNLTCVVSARPPPAAYRWALVGADVNVTSLPDYPCETLDTEDNVLVYRRPNDTTVSTIFCWGINNVSDADGALPTTPCVFSVSGETPPRAPRACRAGRRAAALTVSCEPGYGGGLLQKFTLVVEALESQQQLLAITNLQPQFVLAEPSEPYRLRLRADNEKGESPAIEISLNEIVDEASDAAAAGGAVADITTLALALCGGVALLALAACGLVLCAHDRPPAHRRDHEPAIKAFSTEDSNCETCQSDDDSSGGGRRGSLRRAGPRARRAGSFSRLPDPPPACRVHSMINIARKRDLDGPCDHSVFPADAINRQISTFYSMPRRARSKMRYQADEASEVSQSDGLSLPPPPDELGPRAAPLRSAPLLADPLRTAYATIRKDMPRLPYGSLAAPSLNTVGLPTITGHNSLYSYPDEAVNNPFETSE